MSHSVVTNLIGAGVVQFGEVILSALSVVDQPAMVIGSTGVVLASNAAAEDIFGDDFRIRNRRFVIRDEIACKHLEGAMERVGCALQMPPLAVDPIVVRRHPPKRPIIMRLLQLPGGPVVAGFALILLADPDRVTFRSREALLCHAFGLTRTESRFAQLLTQGLSIDETAVSMTITRETARSHIRSIFAKTGTHKQSELLMLLMRL